MKRPELTEVSRSRIKESRLVITMSPDQWDELLDEGYKRGALLLERDQNEQPVKAYQRRIEAFDSICGRCICPEEVARIYPNTKGKILK